VAEDAGYRVRKAADGTAGLAAVRLAAPALVVTDIYMPGTNGAVVIRELKQGYPEIPVIAISSRFDSGHGMDADAAIALGAARALAKSRFRRASLLRAASRLMESPAGYGLASARAAPSAIAASAVHPVPGIKAARDRDDRNLGYPCFNSRITTAPFVPGM